MHGSSRTTAANRIRPGPLGAPLDEGACEKTDGERVYRVDAVAALAAPRPAAMSIGGL
jgi:hypothetical protein